MNCKAIALSVFLGLSVPTVLEIALAPAVLAQALPIGHFQSQQWTVEIAYNNNTLSYFSSNANTGDTLFLSGASVSGTSDRKVYSWNNGEYEYRVTWRPSDPDTIRLQVFTPNNREVLNRLLQRIDY